MAKTIVRRARKSHWCDSCAHRTIKPGDQYLSGTVFPGDDMGTADTHPVQLRECRECAERYGRGDRFTPTEETNHG